MSEPKKRRSLAEVLGTLTTEVDRHRVAALAATEGARAAQRGIKRLKRKLEARDNYIDAAEKLFKFLEVETLDKPFGASLLLENFKLARQKLGLIKKPRPETAP